MEDLVKNFGLDWKLLLSQAVNFSILFLVLRTAVYRPLLRFMEERRKRIEEGLAKAEEADKRLGEIDILRVKRVKQAEGEALAIIKAGEDKAREEEKTILRQAGEKEEEIYERGRERIEEEKERAFLEAEGKVADVVKLILAKTILLSPEKIDDALIERAASEIKKTA
jgi:F-type H+-transporting ATPase subunit b